MHVLAHLSCDTVVWCVAFPVQVWKKVTLAKYSLPTTLNPHGTLKYTSRHICGLQSAVYGGMPRFLRHAVLIAHIRVKYHETLTNSNALQVTVRGTSDQWHIQIRMVKVKVKVTLVQALRLCTGRTAHRGSRGIALLFHDHGTIRGWGVSVTPRPLFTPRKDPVQIVQETGWAPGPVWTGAENLAPTGIQSLDRPARSLLLYRLSYPAHKYVWCTQKQSQNNDMVNI